MWARAAIYIVGLFRTYAGSIAGSALLALGIGFTSYKGVDLVTTQLLNLIKSEMTGVPIEIQQIAGMLELDTALNIILSAVAVRWTLQGLRGGILRKFGAK